MDYRNLLYERDDRYVTITLNRPERRNCLSSEMLGELEDALRTTGGDGDSSRRGAGRQRPGVLVGARPGRDGRRWASPSFTSCSRSAARP